MDEVEQNIEICQVTGQRLRQIIDLRDTDKSRYFAITEFNNCFIIRLQIFFVMNIFGKGQERQTEIKWLPSHFAHLCGQTQLDDIVHEQTIICPQLFTGCVVNSRPMKRKKNLHRVIR